MNNLYIKTKNSDLGGRPSHLKKPSGPDSSVISSGMMTESSIQDGKMVGGDAKYSSNAIQPTIEDESISSSPSHDFSEEDEGNLDIAFEESEENLRSPELTGNKNYNSVNNSLTKKDRTRN